MGFMMNKSLSLIQGDFLITLAFWVGLNVTKTLKTAALIAVCNIISHSFLIYIYYFATYCCKKTFLCLNSCLILDGWTCHLSEVSWRGVVCFLFKVTIIYSLVCVNSPQWWQQKYITGSSLLFAESFELIQFWSASSFYKVEFLHP